MKDILLISDAIIDSNESFFKENDIVPIHHGVVVDDKELFDSFGEVLKPSEIYEKLRQGEMLSTVQGNIEQIYAAFNQAVTQGKDAIYIAFSSGLSGTYNTACMVAKDVMAENPGFNFKVVDTLSAGAGQGILVREALSLIKQGKDVFEIETQIIESRDYIHHFGVIDNLEHLKRGGRISKTAAMVGGLVGIKPMIAVTEKGTLEPYTKVRSKGKALAEFVSRVNENLTTDTIYISHCDCEDFACEIKNTLLENTSVKNVHIEFLGNTIGCHVGPGAVAIFFKGKLR